MFVVFNKEKISLYTILLSTVIILFGMAFEVKSSNEIEASAYYKQELIYNMVNEEQIK
jgi:hypothetical protein